MSLRDGVAQLALVKTNLSIVDTFPFYIKSLTKSHGTYLFPGYATTAAQSSQDPSSKHAFLAQKRLHQGLMQAELTDKAGISLSVCSLVRSNQSEFPE